MNRPDASSYADGSEGRWPRRRVLMALSAAGVGSAVFARALESLAAGSSKVTADMIRRAEWISGLKLTPEKRGLMLEGMNEMLGQFAELRKVPLDNADPPALLFHPAPWTKQQEISRDIHPSNASGAAGAIRKPDSQEDLAFMSVAEQAALLRSRKISSTDLTRLYLDRLRRFDPLLLCVITLTEELALRQAEEADREIAAGGDRGPLHGIPWGAKDLLSVPGYRTTWGATPFKEQRRDEKATVVSRLEEVGAVLLAKLSVGELAWGDVWFGGTTKNPWKITQGSSGSSAGAAAAAAAGLVGFAIGTETWGSIVSPCTRCGATGLRPTFGRVSRAGAMALAWSMDKIGPIARSVEDCALVFGAVHGADGIDPAAVSKPFLWPPKGFDVRKLKVGFVRSLFDEDYSKWADDPKDEEEKKSLREWQEIDKRTLVKLEEIGVRLVPIELPRKYPVPALSIVLSAEAATAFDELTRNGRDAMLARQIANAWPTVFRQGQMIPAVEYLRANRIRTLLMGEMERLFADLDAYVVPSFGGDNLLLTNLTGHPAVVLPNGFTSAGTPTSVTFQGRLYGETALLALAGTYQQATDFHLRRPPMKPPARSS